MEKSKSSCWLLAAALSMAAVLAPGSCPRAYAFGGLLSSQAARVEQAATQVILVDNPGPTVTAIVRIQYAGPAQDFVWLVPVRGEVTVTTSSSTVFERLEIATAPEYWLEINVEGRCIQDADAGDLPGIPPGFDPTIPPVVPSDRGTVGPYAYVTIPIAAGVDRFVAVDQWLAGQGYAVSQRDRAALAPYLEAGYDLLAFQLRAGMDVGAIRPVSLTYESERPAIPIRLAAASAQPEMGLQVWVIGPSQAVPENYKSLVLNEALIDWLSGAHFTAGTLPGGGAGTFAGKVELPDNYAALVSAAADEAGGHGFVSELGGPASQFRAAVWAALDDENFANVTGQSYDDGVDAVIEASHHYRGWDGWLEAVAGATTLPDGVTLLEFADDPESHRGEVEVDAARFLELLAADVVQPVADSAALLFNGPYLTRLYTTLSAEEMILDPAFDYNPELAQIGHVHIAKQFVACQPTLAQPDAPWRIELAQGGVVVGEGSADWPLLAGSLPANLKVVELSTRGAGKVVVDNGERIGDALYEAAGTRGSGAAVSQLPQHGLSIGGPIRSAETAVPADPDEPVRDAGAGAKDGGGAEPDPEREESDGCSVTRRGTRGAGALALACWSFAAALLLARRRSAWLGSYAALAAALLVACSDGGDGDRDGGPSAARDAAGDANPYTLSDEQLRDPESCRGCHPIHFREWSSSMHAYAAKDPVFLAMNQRGQRETKGELGDFCVRCHAPMAVVDGLTHDGLNLDALPDLQRGVTCFFCHNVERIEGDHNAQLAIARDTTMRGAIRDPLKTTAHDSAYSRLFDEERPESSAMCGACHDIVTPNGVHLERTYEEYLTGIFSKSATGEPPAFDSCVGCHMPPRDGLAAAAEGVGIRSLNEHVWPGIDVALTDFPHREAMRSAVEDCQLNLGLSFFTIEVTPPDLFTITLETAAGHNTPSGAAHDRRMWLELMAYDDDGELIAQSGNIADDELEEHPPGDAKHDSQLLMFRDYIYDARARPVHMFWEAAKSQTYPLGYESKALPVSTTTYLDGKHALVKQYRLSGPDGLPARVTARLRMRPMGLDVLQDLVDSGDLDRAVMAEMPTFTFGTQLEWKREDGVNKPIVAQPKAADCTSYRCLLDPDAPECR